jgi:two-component system invasion response regulator UvrY
LLAGKKTRAMIKILLVDDHELFRAGLRSILSEIPGMSVVGEAGSGEESLEMAATVQPDVVLMDVHMPGIGGIEATRRITRRHEGIKVIAVTALSDEPFPGKLLDAGARGYLSKSCTANEVADAIRAVHAGQHFLGRDVAQKLSIAHLKRSGQPDALSLLTAREMQIMMMITSGQSTQDMSDSLFLSPKTISTYRRRLFEKLGVSNDVELTHYAMRNGLLDKT